MALANLVQNDPERTDVEKSAARIKQLTTRVVQQANKYLGEIREEVAGNKAAIATELGADAAAMASVYNKLREAIEAATGVTVDGIPAE